MNYDLDNMSKSELEQLRKDVEKALKTIDARRKAEAKRAAEAAAKEYGFSLDDLLKDGIGKTTKNPPKYQNPDDPSRTWTGKGRQPDWLKKKVEEGMALEDLAI